MCFIKLHCDWVTVAFFIACGSGLLFKRNSSMLQTLLQTDFIVTIFILIFGSVLLSNMVALLFMGILKLLIIIRRIN